MTERKFKSYTLWQKWRNIGWKPCATLKNLPYPANSPIEILTFWMESRYYTGDSGYWKRGKTWMILPEDREPKGK